MATREAWAQQLRAAAQDVMDHADEIVSDIGPQIRLVVKIVLHTDDERIRFPVLEITRKVIPEKAKSEKLRQYRNAEDTDQN